MGSSGYFSINYLSYFLFGLFSARKTVITYLSPETFSKAMGGNITVLNSKEVTVEEWLNRK
ncbi:MAG: hypothetical protein WCO35_03880 [Candidatus Nomurabacteria bacterium]